MAYITSHSLPTPASDRTPSSPPSDSSSDDSYFNHRKPSSISLLLNPKDDSRPKLPAGTGVTKKSTTKAKRKRITPDQFAQLMALFEHNDTPSYEIRDKLAGKIGMSNREIQVIVVTAGLEKKKYKMCVLICRKRPITLFPFDKINYKITPYGRYGFKIVEPKQIEPKQMKKYVQLHILHFKNMVFSSCPFLLHMHPPSPTGGLLLYPPPALICSLRQQSTYSVRKKGYVNAITDLPPLQTPCHSIALYPHIPVSHKT